MTVESTSKYRSGLEVIKLEYILKLKIKRNDWLLVDTSWVHSQTQNKAQWLAACGHVSTSSQSLRFILSLRMYSSFITSRPDLFLLGMLTLRQRQSKHHNTGLSGLYMYQTCEDDRIHTQRLFDQPLSLDPSSSENIALIVATTIVVSRGLLLVYR